MLPFIISTILYFKKEYKPALENIVQAYFLYVDMNSPYKIDTQKHISFIYNELKKENKLDIFNEATKRFGLDVNFEN